MDTGANSRCLRATASAAPAHGAAIFDVVTGFALSAAPHRHSLGPGVERRVAVRRGRSTPHGHSHRLSGLLPMDARGRRAIGLALSEARAGDADHAGHGNEARRARRPVWLYGEFGGVDGLVPHLPFPRRLSPRHGTADAEANGQQPRSQGAGNDAAHGRLDDHSAGCGHDYRALPAYHGSDIRTLHRGRWRTGRFHVSSTPRVPLGITCRRALAAIVVEWRFISN